MPKSASACLNQATIVFSEDFSDGQVLEGARFENPFARIQTGGLG
jgi:predicted nucleic acid-binding protein